MKRIFIYITLIISILSCNRINNADYGTLNFSSDTVFSIQFLLMSARQQKFYKFTTNQINPSKLTRFMLLIQTLNLE